MEDCVFCKIVEHKIPSSIVLENDSLVVIKDLHPKATIHYLIIPKKHVQDIQSLSEQDLIWGKDFFAVSRELSQKLNVPGHFRFVINSGFNAGQRVFHLHAHFLSGKMSEGL